MEHGLLSLLDRFNRGQERAFGIKFMFRKVILIFPPKEQFQTDSIDTRREFVFIIELFCLRCNKIGSWFIAAD